MTPAAWVERHGLPPGGALLDAAGGEKRGVHRYAALCLTPVEILSWRLGDADDPFHLLESFAGRMGRPSGEAGPWPLVACALGYELGRVVERVPALARDDRHVPDLWAARYEAAYVWDRVARAGRVVATSPAAGRALEARMRAGGTAPAPAVVGRARAEVSRRVYEAAVRRIRAHIAAGDVYQVNHTVRSSAPFAGDAESFFARLRAASPVPFGAMLRLSPEIAVLSTSPERFLRWDASGHVETRPIKGTRPRAREARRDAALADALRASPKDRAEHIMIVDLERNDLGRVCEPGSVRVSRLLAPEAYPTEHHHVSTEEGRLRGGTGLAELLRATFPGGSITGAPKVRAMEIIDALEPVRRGIYCGAVGYLDAAGGGDLNIAIRTAWQVGDRLYYQAGGGIVADSDPATEWAEAGWKARAFMDACRSV